MSRTNDPGRWRRRLVSISAVFVALPLMLASLPIVLPIAAVRDLITRARLAWVRCVLIVAWYLICECWGVLALFGVWLATPLLGAQGVVANTVILQRVWTTALLRALSIVFGMRIEIEGSASVEAGPLLLFVRHSSVADTVLPIWAVAAPQRFTPRYTLKRELRWSPCLDIAAHRIPSVFVHRGEGAAEIKRIATLADDLGEHDIVVLFPEGTRFSASSLDRRITQLRERDDPLLELAERFRQCMPPRSGGALGLTERAPEVDVVFLAHVGFESVRTLADVFGGALIGRRLQVGLWRVRAAEIPRDPVARRRWLFEQWLEVDRWITARLDC